MSGIRNASEGWIVFLLVTGFCLGLLACFLWSAFTG